MSNTQELSEQEEKILHKIYYDEGFTFGRQKLFKLLQSRNIPITRAKVAAWLKAQHINQLYAPTHKHKTIRISISAAPFQSVALDLADMMNFEYKGYKYILMGMDLYSRLAIAIPLKSKTEDETLKGIKTILRRKGFKNTKSFRSDNGAEFKNHLLADYLKTKNIKQIFSSADTPSSNGGIERLNRTIKTLIRKYITLTDNEDWIKILPKIINNYNNVEHEATGKTPNELSELTNQDEIENIKNKMKNKVTQRLGDLNEQPKFQVGDQVRIKQSSEERPRLAFTYSNELYTIAQVRNPRNSLSAPSYRLKDTHGELLPNVYYDTDLLLIPKVDNEIKLPTFYEISRLIEPVKLNNTKSFVVAWKGYRKKSDQTIEPLTQLRKDAPKLIKQYIDQHGVIDWDNVQKITY